MPPLPTVRVNKKAADRVHSGHPWIFLSDVVDVGDARAGDAVRVIDPKARVLGTAHYSSTSQIALRLLSRRVEEIDARFIHGRVEAALAHRKRVVSNSDAYRVVYSEGDLLPGLIADRYGDWLAIQLLDQGVNRLEQVIVQAFAELLQPKGILARNDAAVRAKEDLPRETHVALGEVPEEIEFQMNGLKWRADILHGQKTGVFLDQRENYLAARRYASGHALDCFTATGGFAVHLASICESVEAVDSSEAALATARGNAGLNDLGNIEFRKADVLDYLPGLIAAKRSFDIVVVDPPAFTKSRSALEGAARGYKEINRRALQLLARGGILVSCSCSHHMSEADFLEVIAGASLDCGKQLRVLERRTQSQDHPILLTVPETHYLKCLIFEVL